MEHGDSCEGCQKISLLALGPDFKKGSEIKSRYTLIDIAPTVARLLQFEMDPNVVVPGPGAPEGEPVNDSLVAAPGVDSVSIVYKMEPGLMKGKVMKELFR